MLGGGDGKGIGAWRETAHWLHSGRGLVSAYLAVIVWARCEGVVGHVYVGIVVVLVLVLDCLERLWVCLGMWGGKGRERSRASYVRWHVV